MQTIEKRMITPEAIRQLEPINQVIDFQFSENEVLKPIDIGRNEYGIDMQRKVIHSKSYDLVKEGSFGRFWVEISHSKMKAFVLVFFNKANPFQYMAAVLPLKIADKLLRENKCEAGAFVQRIQLKYGRVLIRGYNKIPSAILE